MFAAAIAALENESDREFMEALYARYYGMMYARALSIVHRHHEAEDIVESVMLKLIDRVDALRNCNRAAFRSYLLSCVKNAALNRLRSEKKLYDFDDVEQQINAVPDESEVDAGLLREAQIETMVLALKQLPDRERALLRMKYYEALSDREIAAILDIRPDSVRTLVKRARARAGRILQEVESHA